MLTEALKLEEAGAKVELKLVSLHSKKESHGNCRGSLFVLPAQGEKPAKPCGLKPLAFCKGVLRQSAAETAPHIQHKKAIKILFEWKKR